MLTIEDVWLEFNFVLDRGMAPVDGRISTDGARNAFLILQGSHFWICLSRDRGDMMVDVGLDMRNMQKLENTIVGLTQKP